jgi:hypothetical protein
MAENEDLNKWAAGLNRRVFSEWKTNYSDWELGFKTLYGPPVPRPEVMIVSLNPGGRKTSALSFQKDKENFENGIFHPPEKISYWSRTDPRSMAVMVKDLYGSHIEMLRSQTVAFPVCFFRSRNWAETKPRRPEMKRFCFPIVNEIIQRLQPKRLLVVASKTYDYLDQYIMGNSKMGAFKERKPLLRKDNRERLYEESKWESEWGTIPVLATIHLTGGHGISNEERGLLREKFHDWFFT